MNIEAIEKAEAFARSVLKLWPEQQDRYFKKLIDLGFTQDEVKGLQEYVALYHMFTDPIYYKKVKTAVGAMLYETFNSK